MPKKLIKVLGAERSGTNYVSWLVIRNLKLETTYEASSWSKKDESRLENDINQSNAQNIHIHPSMEVPHWKHDPPTHDSLFGLPLTYLAVIKNPYSWYFCYKKYAGTHERAPDCSIPASIKRWNDLNISYIKYKQENDNLHLARYEDFSKSPQEQVGIFAEKYGFNFEKDNFQEVNFKAGPGLGIEMVSSNDEFDKVDPFKLYHDKLSSGEIKEINSFLDFSIFEELHYEKLV